MTFSAIPQYTTIAATNLDINGVSIAEGWEATNINNSIRNLLSQLKTECALGSTIASAGTVDISSIHACRISGTTTITAFTITDGTTRYLTFQGALTLTHNVTSLICPGAANITTAAGDCAIVEGIGTNQARVTFYQQAANSINSPTSHAISQGRLTLTSGLAVTTSNVTAATTLFFTPFRGSLHAIYTGTQWVVVSLPELSIAVPATTATNYDVFLDYNSGTPQLALLAWPNQTTRATALTTQDGILVLTGTLTKKYLGSFATTLVSGQTEDSQANRLVWNYYNRMPRSLQVQDATSTWTYSLVAFRQANANAANKASIVCGIAEDTVNMTVLGAVSTITASGGVSIGIGINSTTASTGGTPVIGIFSVASGTGGAAPNTFQSILGKNDYNWLESGLGSGTQTWRGGSVSGLYGSCMA